MKVLLLGGTGAMGSHLATLLHGDGMQVTVTSRSRAGLFEGASYIKGNAHDEAFLKEVLSGDWDCIVDFMVYSTAQFTARAELFQKSTRQYIFLSTARVFAESAGPLQEKSERLLDTSKDSAYLLTDEYALSKARQENILLKSGHTNWTVVRPYVTYSHDRLQLGHLEKEQWLYRALKGRPIVFSKDIGSRLTTVTHGRDVARTIAALIGDERALGTAFNITVDESLRWSDALDLYLDVIEEHTGRRPKVLLQDLDETRSWSPSVHQIVYDRMYDRSFDTAKISEFIDVSSFARPREGLKAALKAFLAAPSFLDLDWRAEARKDRATRSPLPLSEIATPKAKIKYLLHRM